MLKSRYYLIKGKVFFINPKEYNVIRITYYDAARMCDIIQ